MTVLSTLTARITICVCLGILVGMPLRATDRSELFNAMDAEILRAMTDLNIGDLPRPYHIEARLTLSKRIGGHASLGSIESVDSARVNTLSVRIRVGAPKFDNTNFFDVSLGFFGSSDDEEPFTNRTIPLELDATTLRRELWLALDACYKQSVEVYAKKQATVKNRTRQDTTWDYALMIAESKSDTSLQTLTLSTNTLVSTLEKVSGEFATVGTVQASRVTMEFVPKEILYTNSEGRHAYKFEAFTGFEISATSQAPDGMPLSDTYAAYATNPKDLPSTDSLRKAARKIIANLTAQQHAKTIEAYSGPVLFTGQAAAQIIAQQFAPNLVAQRAQGSEGGFSMGSTGTMSFQNKIGARVLPEFLSVKSVPSLQMFDGSPVAGHMTIDDEGIATQDVNLVDKGFLRTLLASRVPTKRIKASNGNCRNGGAMISVVRLICEEQAKQLSTTALVEKMLKLVKDRELDYGIVVSAVQDKNLLITGLYPIMLTDLPMMGGQGVVPRLQVEKVFPNGKRELVRGVEAAGFAAATFKDILAVGTSNTVHNYLAPSVIPGFITGGSGYSMATIITPDLLFEDVEIRPLEADLPKLPMIPNPIN